MPVKPLELVKPIPTVSAMSGRRRLQAVRRLARAGKLTEAVRLQITDLVGRGCTYETAATASGVTSRTLRRWRERAELGEEPFSTFEQMLAEARAAHLVRLCATVHQDAITDGRLALEVLARRDPDNWGKRDQLALSGPAGGPVQLQTVTPDWSKLDDAQKDQLAALLDLALPRRQVEVAGQMVDADEP